MYDRTLAIYCFVDDLLKAMRHAEDPRTKFSDAEVMTTAIVAMLFFGGNFEQARRLLHSSGMMPRMQQLQVQANENFAKILRERGYLK